MSKKQPVSKLKFDIIRQNVLIKNRSLSTQGGKYEKKYQKNVESIKSHDKSELFTIAGRHFYTTGINPVPGMELKLVREPYNEFDRDAIAVFVDDEKIGYVANSDYTKYYLTSSAFEIKDRIQGVASAEYVLYLERYADIQFAIGRLVG